MKNLVKKILILFVIVFMFCMMTITFAATMHEFDLNEIPSKMTVHLGDEVKLPKENEGIWEVTSNEKYASIEETEDGKVLFTKASGTAKIRLKTSDKIYNVSIKISGHKYDKTTNECVCGAKKPVSTLKFKSSSFVFEENDVIEMAEYCTIKPAVAIKQIGWYVDTITSLNGNSIATIEYGSGKLTLKGIGVGKVVAVDSCSPKQATAYFAVFDDELLSQYNLCLGETVKLPIAAKNINWEIASGDNKLQEIDDNEYKGIKAGTAKLEYETDAGKFTTKIKVANHKFNKTTGLCVCGAKQPPKTMKFNESTFLFNYYDRLIDFTDSKYISVKPTGAIEDFEWDVETIKDWYEGTTEIATINDDGELKLKDWGSGKVYAIDPNSKKEIEANFIIFTDEISESLELHIGEKKSLPLAEPNVGWEVIKGDNKVKINEAGSFITALAKGTADILYSSEVGDVKVKVKVVNHKFDKKTGKCECGAMQPPKKMEFESTSFIVESGEKIDISSSKYFTIKPEGALEDVEWEIETISSWYEYPIVMDVATVKGDGIVRATGEYGIAKLTATHAESKATDSTYIIISENELNETIVLHPGDEIELPRIENDGIWRITSGTKYLGMRRKYNNVQIIEALSKGSAVLEYKTSVGVTVKVKVKVTKEHVYNKTTGLCDCGAERPPEVMKFNSSSYILPLGKDEIEMSSSKYFTVEPESALENIIWQEETVSDWYDNRDEFVILVDKTEGNVIPMRLGIAEFIAYHKDSKQSVSTYIIVPDKKIEDEITLHIGDNVELPRIEKDIYWKVDGETDLIEMTDNELVALKEGTVTLIYETSIGKNLVTKVLVTDEHIYDEAGNCGCGKNKYGLTQEVLDKLAELEIIAEPVDGTFVVDKTVTRGEVASLLIGLLNKRDEAEKLEEEQTFTDGYDADKDAYMWWNGYANLALELGLINGYEDGTFKGEKSVSNAEFIKLMIVLLGYEPEERENGDHWAAGYMATAEEINLLDGINEELFDWNDSLTRGNAAIILYNALGIKVSGKGAILEELVFEESRIEFFVITDKVFREDSTTYVVPLMNEDCEDEYLIADDSEARTWAKANYEDDSIIGSFVWVQFNEDDEIEEIEILADSENGLSKTKKIHYGYGNEYYSIEEYELASYDDNTNEIVNEDDNDETIAVRSSTVLIKLIYNASDDTYEVEFSEGLSAFKDIDNERVAFVYDANVKSKRAKYVITYEGVGEKTELKNQVGRVIKTGVYSDGNKLVGVETENGDTSNDYKYIGDTEALKDYALIVYDVTSDEFLELVYGIDNKELNLQTETSSYVSEIETTRCVTLDGEEFDLDSKENLELYEDYVVIEVNVDDSDDVNQYEVSAFETFNYEDIKIKAYNRIIIDEDTETFFVIKGMAERVEEGKVEEPVEGETTENEENTETTPTTMKFNSTSFIIPPNSENVDMTSSKYFTIDPTDAIDGVKWSVKEVTQWYESSIRVSEGLVTTSNAGYLSGIAELTATHTDTNTTASTYLFVFDEEVQDEITVHVGDTVYLPMLESGAYWESSNNNIAEVNGRYLNTSTVGEVSLTYETSVGIPVTMKVIVTEEHLYDDEGHCVCEDTGYTITEGSLETQSGLTQEVLDKLAEHNIMTTYNDGTFKPGYYMPKTKVAKALVASLNKVEEAESLADKKVFSDIYDLGTGDILWWNGYANLVAELGISQGNPDGTFDGNKTVTNAEFITMVLRMLGYQEVVETKGTWPTNYIVKAGELELLEGTAFASYNDTLTRDVAAVILYNALQTEVYGEGKTLEELAFGATAEESTTEITTENLNEEIVEEDIEISNETTSENEEITE